MDCDEFHYCKFSTIFQDIHKHSTLTNSSYSTYFSNTSHKMDKVGELIQRGWTGCGNTC